MGASITLKVSAGSLKGAQYVIEERTTCVIGRALDCYPCLPDDEAHKTISRYHCLLDLNPPAAIIRDFGSLNGTYINDKKIGQRDKDQSPEEATRRKFREHPLKHGDCIRIGKTVFEVLIKCDDPPPTKAGEKRPALLNTVYDAEAERAPCPPARGTVEEPVAQVSHDPLALVEELLSDANASEQALQAIQGYTLIKELGRGGMGSVYLAQKNQTDQPVALKILLPQVAKDPKVVERFSREIQLTKALNHRNIVQLFEHGNHKGVFFFTLEYCDYGPLKRLMRQHGGTVPLKQALEITLQLLDGLHYAHNLELKQFKLPDGSTTDAHGIVHRDIKPANLLLANYRGKLVAKISDYGLAKNFDMAGLSGLTRTGQIGGTPSFMPRQQVINFKYAKTEVDVWAVAASLYYMLTGCTPRDFPKDKDPWMIVLQEPATPIRVHNPEIPQTIAEVIDEALIDKPIIKIQTAQALKQALQDVM